MYELTSSKDGLDRLDLKVTHRMSLSQMAELIVLSWGMEHELYSHSVKIALKLPNKLEAVKAAKDGLIWNTLETAPYRVGDNGFYIEAGKIEHRLKQLWKVT